MLVLTRKRTEEIKIGKDIVIKVIHTGKGTVKLGIDAPVGVKILRGELFEELQATELMTAEIMLDEAGQPLVADAVAEEDVVVEMQVVPAVPVTADKFLQDYEENVPGRSIRRMLQARRHAMNAAAK